MKNDLTEGKITGTLVKLAMPIMATSIVQMAYNMTDLIWLGRLGSKAVAAVGTAGFFTWFGFAFILISKVGAEISVSQSLGRKNLIDAREYARNALYLVLFFAVFWMTVLLIFNREFIGFFQISEASVNEMACTYLSIVALGIVFSFLTMVFTGIYNGCGDSRTPFYITTAALLLNIVLDPLLIFGIGPFPVMGVSGAAISTVLAQGISTLVFLLLFLTNRSPFPDFHFLKRPRFSYIKRVFQLGLPVALESAGFTIFSIFLARIISRWGALPIAVQRIGAQIEAISWMSASGFATALSAIVGQNFGARQWARIWHSYFSALKIVMLIGAISTFLFLVFPKQIFSLFLPEKEAVIQGAVYLRILGVSQIFMCIEIISAGGFKGMGRTIPPTIISLSLTGLRIPLALLLSSYPLFGLNGVWWSMSITSIFKGLILVTWFLLFLHSHPCIVSSLDDIPRLLAWNSRYLRDKRSFSGKC
ncbi:MAG: MATE family efflux transporter [Candidatus Cloacimonetes bacterium]|nr:MATE family efflux transporter [Candidatus Cloacimonadota bacterium]